MKWHDVLQEQGVGYVAFTDTVRDEMRGGVGERLKRVAPHEKGLGLGWLI